MTLEALEQVMRCAPRARLLVVITSRPKFTPTLAAETVLETLVVGRLSRAGVLVMIKGLTAGKTLPKEILEQIVAKTDGVPLFVKELTKAILESSLMREADDHYELTGALTPLTVPATLQDALMSRLDRLASAKEVAQISSAIGREFPRDLLAA
jgi:predicted ATPase